MNSLFPNSIAAIPEIPLGKWGESFVRWLKDTFEVVFDGIKDGLDFIIMGLENFLLWPHPFIMLLLLVALVYYLAGRGVAIFSFIGLLLLQLMSVRLPRNLPEDAPFLTQLAQMEMPLWESGMQTIALVLISTIIALAIGIPIGLWSARNRTAEQVIRPVLDFMQTMPAFVYLIPAVIFFSLGRTPGVFATVIFAMPPAVRLTQLGIKQVPSEVVEAAVSFGATARQLLFKVQLPIAMPTILAGVNQTIMLALSMVVIGGLIGAPGLGEQVVRGVSRVQLDVGIEAGVGIVIIAIVLDRITQGFSQHRKKKG